MTDSLPKNVAGRYEFDVALSYAGEDGARAEQLAFALKRRGARVFYDKDEAARLWGENLYTYLTDVYQNRARYCVALLSRHYAAKPWTLQELEAAQARAFRQQEPYLLPVRLDDTEISSILPTVAYLCWSSDPRSGESSDSIAELVLERLATEPSTVAAPRRLLRHIDWLALEPDYFEPFDAADQATDSRETLERVYGSIWLPERDDTWTSSITGGTYRLTNQTDPSAIRYYYLRLADRDMGESPVSVEVAMSGAGAASGAGLVYRFDRERRHYYAFVAAPDEQLRFYSRDSSGFRILFAGRHTLSAAGGFRKLAITAAGADIHLYVNDVLVRKLHDDSQAAGDTGIAAFGKGAFEFDNFTIYR